MKHFGVIEIVSNEIPTRYMVIEADSDTFKWRIVKECGMDGIEAYTLARDLDNREIGYEGSIVR